MSPFAPILVVDDDPNNLEIATIILRGAGFEVLTARNGAEALTCCHSGSHAVSLVLMDLLMPVMDGVEATRQLRADPRTRELPVIIVSARSSTDISSAFTESGASGYLQKPYRRGALLEAIRAAGLSGPS